MDRENELRIAKEIYGGRFELICKKMQLLNCPTYDGCWLEGTGIIRADDRGHLSFQMVAPYGNTKAVPRRSTVPLRQLYAPTDYVMLCAIDQNGREWRSNWIVPDPFIGALRHPNWIVNQALNTIGHSSQRTNLGESIGRQYIPSRRDLPFDRGTQTVASVDGEEITTQLSKDHHVHKIAQAEVEFRELEREWLLVETRQAQSVMPNWSGLVCQSLSFATARTVRPVVDVRIFGERYDIGLFSGPFLDFRTHLSPPVHYFMDPSNDFWALVQKFIEWAVAKPELNQPLFDELDGIRSGATGSLETACLTLAIGIEALGGILLKNEPVTKAPLDPNDISKLREHVAQWQGNEGVRKRAMEMLGPLDRIGKATSVDRLYAFAGRIDLPHDLLKRWKSLRTTKAHGLAHDANQSLYDLYYSTVELLYRLIGDAIGYEGKITKTSQRGWDVQHG